LINQQPCVQRHKERRKLDLRTCARRTAPLTSNYFLYHQSMRRRERYPRTFLRVVIANTCKNLGVNPTLLFVFVQIQYLLHSFLCSSEPSNYTSRLAHVHDTLRHRPVLSSFKPASRVHGFSKVRTYQKVGLDDVSKSFRSLRLAMSGRESSEGSMRQYTS
jgi:hypothetical protein